MPTPMTRIDQVKYWFKPSFAFLIYALTVYIAASAPSRHTVLGRVSASLGTWIIVMLAKSSDVAFGFAVADAIDTMTWRKLTERLKINRGERFIGIRLEWFLALISSTGVEGLVKILARSRKKGWGRYTAGRWALLRLIFITALIPGPGIILTSNIKQRNVFFPIRTIDISGGLAEFDPQLAATYHTVLGPSIARYTESMLEDRSVTWPVLPLSKDCRKDSHCDSYLIAGPYQAITPWPFTVESKGVDAYRIYDAPFVQVDIWYPPPTLMFSASKDCTLYGGANATVDFSMILCIAQQNSDGLLAAGWKSCQSGYGLNGTCLDPGAPNSIQGWSTYLQFYHRKATVTFSRSQFSIQEVTHLSAPTPYYVNTSSLFQAINTILYRPNQITSDARFDSKSMQYIMTQNIASRLWYSLNTRFESLTLSKTWLRNVLTLPLYVFQPTMSAFARNLAPLAEDIGAAPQPNLPSENYVNGSYCTVDTRSIPSRGTVIAYTVVAGIVLVFVGASKLIATLRPHIETSEFPMLDFEVLTVLADENDEEVSLGMKFLTRQYKKDKILEDIKDLRIGLRRI